MDRRRFLLASLAAPLLFQDELVAQSHKQARKPSVLARLTGGTPLALVTADTEARLVAVELSTGRIHRRLKTLPGPRSIESVLGTVAVVAHTAHGAVSIVDGPSLRVRAVLRGFSEPRYTAAGPGGRFAYVTDSGRGEVVVLDVERGGTAGRVEVGGPARHISIAPNGRTLWVALGTKAELIAVVDVSRPARLRLVRTFRPPFLAHDVGFSPNGRTVWVTAGDRGAMAVYDARDASLVARLPADAPPQHLSFLGGFAHVTSGDDGTLRVHRLQDGRILRTTRVPVGSYNVQQGWGRVLTPSLSQGTLCVLDGRGRLVQRVVAAASSHDACFVMSA